MLPIKKGVLFSLLGWRATLFIVAALAPLCLPLFLISFPYSERLVSTGFPVLVWPWGNFDGVHYIGIAQTQYGAYFTQAFFPLYPLLMGILGQGLFFFADAWQRLLLSGLFLSYISLGLFVWSLYVLARIDNLAFAKGSRLLWSVLLFPTAFFFAAVYSESLFLVFVVGCFIFLRRQKFWLAALCVGLATATRFVGVALLPALWWEYTLARRRSWNRVDVGKLLSLSVLSLLGLVLYSSYLFYRFGDPFLFAHVQGAFGASRTSDSIVTFPQVLYRYLKIVFTVPWHTYPYFTAILELGATLGALTGLFIAVRKRIRSSYVLFSGIALLIPTLTGSLTSMPRYILVAFPLYFVLADLPRVTFRIWISLSAALLVVLTTLFLRGYWVA